MHIMPSSVNGFPPFPPQLLTWSIRLVHSSSSLALPVYSCGTAKNHVTETANVGRFVSGALFYVDLQNVVDAYALILTN